MFLWFLWNNDQRYRWRAFTRPFFEHVLMTASVLIHFISCVNRFPASVSRDLIYVLGFTKNSVTWLGWLTFVWKAGCRYNRNCWNKRLEIRCLFVYLFAYLFLTFFIIYSFKKTLSNNEEYFKLQHLPILIRVTLKWEAFAKIKFRDYR